MNSSLPQFRQGAKYYVTFVVVLLLGVFYFYIRGTTDGTTSSPKNKYTSTKSSAFFVPPNSTTKEVTVTGKVVRIADDEKVGASHKVVDSGGATIIYAYANDDKLLQQEENVITLVGEIPFGENLSSSSLMEVSYISFK